MVLVKRKKMVETNAHTIYVMIFLYVCDFNVNLLKQLFKWIIPQKGL
jgi:hypothetical protein